MTSEQASALAARIEATSTYLAASVAFADDVRAILHGRGDTPDAELIDRIDAAYDRYWHTRRGTGVAERTRNL